MMICQHCGSRPATTHLKKTVNGQTAEAYLCSECAAEQGLSLWGDFHSGFENLFGGLFSAPAARGIESTRCAGCGRSFADISGSGQVGCPTCYTTFYDRLLPSIQRIHGKSLHAGKVPAEEETPAQAKAKKLNTLKAGLQAALDEQDYETCARLRDEIRELEGADDHE